MKMMFHLSHNSIAKSFIYGRVLQRHDKCDQNCLELFEMFPKAPIIYKEEHEKNLTNQKKFILVSSSKGATNQELSAYYGLKASQVEYIKKGLTVEQNLDNPFFINKFHIEWIEKFIGQERVEALFNLQDIYLAFLRRFKFKKRDISNESFRKILISQGYSYKLPLRHSLKSSTPKHLSSRKNFVYSLCSYLKAGVNLLFLDEYSLGHRGQLKRMQEIIIIRSKLCRISLGAIGSNGFLNYEQIAGHFDCTRFYLYMVILLEQASHHYKQSNFVFILDNAPIHKGKCMLELYEKFTYLFLPTYTPQFNAIELIWNQVKNYLSQKNVHSGLASHALIHQTFNQITDKSIKGCISYVLQIMLKCINEERERE